MKLLSEILWWVSLRFIGIRSSMSKTNLLFLLFYFLFSCSQGGKNQNSIDSSEQSMESTILKDKRHSIKLGATMALSVYLNLPPTKSSLALTLSPSNVYLNEHTPYSPVDLIMLI